VRYRFKLSEFIHHPITKEVLKELKWKPTDTLILDTIKDGMNVSIMIKKEEVV
jgi:hypothetical protein